MKKKFIQVFFVISFLLFSFYYTNKVVEVLKNIDPIMKKINADKNNYETKSVNAVIFDDEIVPGYSGYSVDVNKSYTNMKKMNKYNNNYYIYNEVLPIVSIKNNYNKYITKGNYLKNSVSLIFKINKEADFIDDIYNKLEDKNIIGTFFIDGVYINKNSKKIYDLNSSFHEIEILNYNNSFDEENLIMMRSNLKNIINYEGKYCLINSKDYNILNLCSSNNMYTIIPTFVLNSFNDLKINLDSGAIIEINNNKIKELSTIINFIRQKGYNIVSLEELLSENRTMEK